MKESYLPHAILRAELVGKWWSLEGNPTVICIFVKTYTIHLSLLAAMGKGKYPELSRLGGSGSEPALWRQRTSLAGVYGVRGKVGFGLCVSHSCLSRCVTPPHGYFYTRGVRLKQGSYKLAEAPFWLRDPVRIINVGRRSCFNHAKIVSQK